MSDEEMVGLEDERFSSAKTDPRFKRVPRQVRKLEIDDRFKGMFNEERFQLNYSLDKRGRPVTKTTREDLQRYYRLEGAEAGGPSPAELVCRSRGEIQLDTSSSSESDEEDTGLGREELLHAWAEFDQSVGTTDTSTARLAVCNMDWDRTTANDIFVLLSSIIPDHGHIKSVRVFPSEYGSQRLQIEEAVGPEELMGTGEGDMGGTEDQTQAQEIERLRKYQFNRLMYYYAIVETDSSATSDYLYEQCNGIEFELTGTKLDLRVVPDGMDFSDTVAFSSATSETLPLDYHPATFHNSALQHTKVHLSWDETDPERQKILNQDFSNKDIREMDFQAYLASGSETEEGSEGEGEGEGGAVSEDKTIDKFRALLAELESTESSVNKTDIDLEITWEPGKLAPLEETINRRTGEGERGLTPWEEYIQKRSEKKKSKRNKRKESNEEIIQAESVFTELGGNKKSVRFRDKQLPEREQRERGELELLVVSDSEGEGREKQHFNMKEVWKNNKLSEKKKRKLIKKGLVKEDNFNLDLNDSRFVGLLESPMFAPDPSDPQFHQGRNLKGIIDERKRRREIQLSQGTGIKRPNMRNIGSPSVSTEQAELVALVRKLKNKHNRFQTRKTNKIKI